MKKSAAKISLIVFIVIFLASMTIPVTAGGLIPVYLVLCIFASVIIGTGKGKMRITGAICLVFAVYLSVNEYNYGKDNPSYRERAEKIRAAQSK